MTATFRKSFVRDLKKINKSKLTKAIQKVIEDVEAAASFADIAGVKKLAGTSDCFRIRVGEFRIGLILERDVVDFVRCLPRRDLYKFFP